MEGMIVDVCCTETELGNLFPSYLKGRVTADERSRIEEHLARCEECRRELEFFAAAQRARNNDIVAGRYR